MKAPWNGEKVNIFIRCLAILFIICAVIALSGLLFSVFEKGHVSFNRLDFMTIIGAFFVPYYFLLFSKVAFTGHAPKSWIPWK